MKILMWDDLTEEEKEQAKETYLFIREIEEDRLRNEITQNYDEPINENYVKYCKFERKENGYIEVII